eukprot:3935132-Rhodomonas_salina.1
MHRLEHGRPACRPREFFELLCASLLRSYAVPGRYPGLTSGRGTGTVIQRNGRQVIYDVTRLLRRHEGGRTVVEQLCGVDGSISFYCNHDVDELQESLDDGDMSIVCTVGSGRRSMVELNEELDEDNELRSGSEDDAINTCGSGGSLPPPPATPVLATDVEQHSGSRFVPLFRPRYCIVCDADIVYGAKVTVGQSWGTRCLTSRSTCTCIPEVAPALRWLSQCPFLTEHVLARPGQSTVLTMCWRDATGPFAVGTPLPCGRDRQTDRQTDSKPVGRLATHRQRDTCTVRCLTPAMLLLGPAHVSLHSAGHQRRVQPQPPRTRLRWY